MKKLDYKVIGSFNKNKITKNYDSITKPSFSFPYDIPDKKFYYFYFELDNVLDTSDGVTLIKKMVEIQANNDNLFFQSTSFIKNLFWSKRLVGEFSLSEIICFKDFESIILPDKTLPSSLYEIFDGNVALFTKCGEVIIEFDGESRLCIIGVTKLTEKLLESMQQHKAYHIDKSEVESYYNKKYLPDDDEFDEFKIAYQKNYYSLSK